MSILEIIEYAYNFIVLHIIEIFKNIFSIRRRCESEARLDGKVVVITGANTGIGKETAFQLSLRGPKIIIGCRDLKKAEEAVNDIKTKNPSADIMILKLDLSSLKSVRKFSREVSQKTSRIDILINNAGVMTCPEWQTEDGFEFQFGVNHLGHFLLTILLLPLLKKSESARIITVSSLAHNFGKINLDNIHLRNGAYDPFKSYAQSKLANVYFSSELAKRLDSNSNVKTYSLHPGVIYTELNRHVKFSKIITLIFKFICISIDLGTQTTLFCALDEKLENESGFYYDDCKRVRSRGTDETIARKLWEMSCDLVNLEKHQRF